MASLYTYAVETGYKLLSKTTPYTAWNFFRELQQNQWLSLHEIKRLNWHRLKKILDFTYENIPFYQKLWNDHNVDPRRFTSQENLRDLPIVDKSILNKAREEDGFFLSKHDGYEVAHTSGTTGIRFQVPFNLETFQKKYASHLRQVYACGWRLGMKSATLHYAGHTQFRGKYAGRPGDREPFMGIRETALGFAHRRKVLEPYYKTETGDDRFVDRWYRDIAGYKPYMFETMDYNLPMLKDYIEQKGLPLLSIPKTFVLGTYSASLRKRLQQFFSTEIFDRYSPHEIEGVAFSCEKHRGMHMALESYCVEFLDDADRPVEPETIGHIIVTDLENYLMPLIRYRIGDLGHYYDEPCACGRGLPLMGEIDGRVRDSIKLPDGRSVAPSQAAAVLQDEEAVVLFQVTQRTGNDFSVTIVPGPTYSEDAAKSIRSGLEALFGKDCSISIECTASIALEQNGKCSFVKNDSGSP